MARVRFRIKDGHVDTEVLDRQGEKCKNVERLTVGIGENVSAERTSDDCEEVHEGLME